MTILLVIGIGLGAAVALWHRERMREVEERVRTEMQKKIELERKLHMRDEMRLYDEIVDLMAQLAAVETGEQKALAAAYQQGRRETRREMNASDAFIKSYERQRVYLAMKGGC